jgi:hypothetical protein
VAPISGSNPVVAFRPKQVEDIPRPELVKNRALQLESVVGTRINAGGQGGRAGGCEISARVIGMKDCRSNGEPGEIWRGLAAILVEREMDCRESDEHQDEEVRQALAFQLG